MDFTLRTKFNLGQRVVMKAPIKKECGRCCGRGVVGSEMTGFTLGVRETCPACRGGGSYVDATSWRTTDHVVTDILATGEFSQELGHDNKCKKSSNVTYYLDGNIRVTENTLSKWNPWNG